MVRFGGEDALPALRRLDALGRMTDVVLTAPADSYRVDGELSAIEDCELTFNSLL